MRLSQVTLPLSITSQDEIKEFDVDTSSKQLLGGDQNKLTFISLHDGSVKKKILFLSNNEE